MKPSERSRMIRFLIAEHGLDNFLEEIAEECDAKALYLLRSSWDNFRSRSDYVAVVPKKEHAGYRERQAHKYLGRRDRIMEIATGIREGKI